MNDFNNALDVLFTELNSWWVNFLQHLPNIIVALVVVVAMVFASRSVKKLVNRLVDRFSSKTSLNRLISSIVSFLLLGLGLILVLNILDLEQTVSSLLAGAGIAGLVIGFAFQDALSNTFAGIMLSINDLFNIGDHIKTPLVEGHIKHIGMRFLQVMNFQGHMVIIPNKRILKDELTNFSLTDCRRIDLECSVSYGDDLEKAEKLAVQAVSETIALYQNKGVEFFYTEFGSSSINFVIRFWTSEKGKGGFFQDRHNAIKALKKTFDDNGITIPYPIRTLDFGIKGGQKLGEVLPETSVLTHNGSSPQ